MKIQNLLIKNVNVIFCRYLRKDVISLGQCTINFSNIPSEKYENYVKNIYEILELMVPKSHYFPMTLDNMNSLEFTPK